MKPDTTPRDRAQLLERKTPFRGRLVTVQVDRILLPNGREVVREVVVHPGAVAVVASPAPGKVLLVRQYRHPTGASLWEIPAGKLEPDEPPLACGKRELEEETGFRASRWKRLLSVYTTPGFTNERITLFAATGLQWFRTADDHDVADCKLFSTVKLQKMIERSEIEDAKTVLGLIWAGLVLRPTGDEA